MPDPYQVMISAPGAAATSSTHQTLIQAVKATSKESRRMLREEYGKIKIDGKPLQPKYRKYTDEEHTLLNETFQELSKKERAGTAPDGAAKQWLKENVEKMGTVHEKKVHMRLRMVGDTLVEVEFLPSVEGLPAMMTAVLTIQYMGSREKGLVMTAEDSMGREILAHRIRQERARTREIKNRVEEEKKLVETGVDTELDLA